MGETKGTIVVKRSRSRARVVLLAAIMPVVGFFALATGALLAFSSSNTAADTPTYALTCSADGIPVSLSSVVTEGVFTTSSVAPSAVDNLKANSADDPNSAFGAYNVSTNPSGVNLLNGPDAGFGIVIIFPSTLEPLTTAGDSVGFSGTVPLTVNNGSGSPSLSVSGAFTVPSTYPTNAAIVVHATQSGSITAGSSGSLSVALPQFTSGSPLSLTIAIGSTDIPITCTSAASQTIATAAIGSGGTGTTGNTGTTSTTASTTSTTTSSTTTTTTTTPSSTTSTTAPANAPADSPTYSLACTAASVPVNLPSAVTEGVFETNPVAAGAVDNLAPNKKAVPNSLLSGVNLLNGPDTGLGVVIEFPTSLEPLTTPGATVTFSGTLPLVVTGGIGTPSLNLSGSFTVPATYPSDAAVVVTGTQTGGSITAGQQTSMTVTQPQFTSASPLDLTVAIGSTNVPITCTSSSSETLDTATITGGNGTATPANPPSAGTSSGSSGSGSAAGKTATDASLAFTGPGPGIWALAIGGLILIDLGYLLLTSFYRPRELFAMAGRKVNRIFGSDDM
jgi:cell division septation protein DedD